MENAPAFVRPGILKLMEKNEMVLAKFRRYLEADGEVVDLALWEETVRPDGAG